MDRDNRERFEQYVIQKVVEGWGYQKDYALERKGDGYARPSVQDGWEYWNYALDRKDDQKDFYGPVSKTIHR